MLKIHCVSIIVSQQWFHSDGNFYFYLLLRSDLWGRRLHDWRGARELREPALTTATSIAQSCLEENRRVGYASAGATPLDCSNDCLNVTQCTVSFTGAYCTPTLASIIQYRLKRLLLP